MNSGSVYDIKKLTPAQCSEKCKMNEYFALKVSNEFATLSVINIAVY